MANSVLCVKINAGIGPRKMHESNEGDPEVGERFCVWKTQEAC